MPRMGKMKTLASPEFQARVAANPGIIRSFLRHYGDVSEKTNFGPMAVTPLKVDGENHVGAWRVDFGAEAYFVKQCKLGPELMRNGYCQFGLYETIGNLIDAQGLGNVLEAGKIHLGCANGKASFVVMGFYDMQKLSEIKWWEVKKRWASRHVRKAMKKLRPSLAHSGLSDLGNDHIFFDSVRKKGILIDPD